MYYKLNAPRAFYGGQEQSGMYLGGTKVWWRTPPSAPVETNLLDLSVPPASPEGVNYWVVDTFNPLIMGAKPGATSALTGWPFLARASTRYRISWDYTPIGFSWTGGDRVRCRIDDTGSSSSTGRVFSQSSANPLVSSFEYYNSSERMMWIGPAAVISGAQRLQVNRFFLEVVS